MSLVKESTVNFFFGDVWKRHARNMIAWFPSINIVHYLHSFEFSYAIEFIQLEIWMYIIEFKIKIHTNN